MKSRRYEVTIRNIPHGCTFQMSTRDEIFTFTADRIDVSYHVGFISVDGNNGPHYKVSLHGWRMQDGRKVFNRKSLRLDNGCRQDAVPEWAMKILKAEMPEWARR